MSDTDVIVVGAGPTGLMLATELRLNDVRTLVLERRPQISEIPKAGGLGGQILQVLRYRGLLDRFTEAGCAFHPQPVIPFGGVHLDFSHLVAPRCRPCPSSRRSSSACSMSAPTNSAPRSVADTRSSP